MLVEKLEKNLPACMLTPPFHKHISEVPQKGTGTKHKQLLSGF
jgi:hypothetical protein